MNHETFQEDLPGILLLSHGPFCAALLESAQMIAGEAKNVVALPLLENADIGEYGANAMRTFHSMPEGSIVLFDLASGTPFNQMMLNSNGERFSGLCGVSLPILIEALALREVLQGDELIDALASSGHEAIVNIASFFEEEDG